MRNTLILSAIGIILHLAIASVSVAAPMLSFIIDGDTFSQPYAITNSSTAGENVVRFQLDLSTVAGPAVVYDTVNGGVPNSSGGVPFTPVGGDAALTGLVLPASVADGATLLDISFTDFNSSETFRWDIDVDFAVGSVTVYGDNLIGATAIIDFSDGQRLTGILQAVPGNADAAQFTVTGITQTPNEVPEPTTLVLWSVMSGAGLAAWRRRRNASAL